MDQNGNKLNTLTIGVPVHNEEQSLPQFYETLVNAINRLPRYVDVEVVFCVNGCTDESEEILREKTNASGRMAKMSVIESNPGKMNAQMAIVENREFDGPIAFCDADILMKPTTLQALHRELEEHDRTQVAYARVLPFYENDEASRNSAFTELLFAHYNYRHLQPERKYFHGRAFMMRDSSMLEHMNDDLEARVERVRREESPWYVTHLGLEKGPLIDDIFLSRMVVAEHGTDAIKKVDGAEILFHPPSSVEDYARVIERTQAEIKRLDLLYPEHDDLQETVFRREFRDVSQRSLIPEGERKKLQLLRDMEAAIKQRVDDALTAPDDKPHPFASAHWMRAGSTKRNFGDNDQLPLLFQNVHGEEITPEGEAVSPPLDEDMGSEDIHAASDLDDHHHHDGEEPKDDGDHLTM